MNSFRVLIVEDSPSDLRLIREALKETAFPVQIAVARDGEEAIDYLRRVQNNLVTRPHLVLLDLNLPRKSGKQVLAEVKASPVLRQIPILVMTTSRADADIIDAYRLNANGYITKPDDLPGYVRVLRSIEDFWFMTATLPDGFRLPLLTNPNRLAS
ncbi:MAG TPA: response regulator [Bryobacteraceae bacterium]|jgi:chemotaxis family two-component system response regulator Rcp1